MLNVYDIRIDESGTNASSTLTGNIVFDATNNNRVVLSTSNIRESGSNFYFNVERQEQSTSFYDNIYVRMNDKRLFNENVLIVKKNPGLGEYSSLADAIAAVTNNTAENFIKISVGPGNFYEPELFVPSFVSIVGEGIQDTTILPQGYHNIFHLQNPFVELSFFRINGATAGYVGIHIDDAGDYTQIHKISFDNCDTNVLIESITQPTFFYGEYFDYNGEYSFGTKVISNNGFEAFANLENYYNFPTGGNPIGTYLSGSNSHVDIYTSGNISYGGGTAIYLEDGADIGISAANIENWDIGLHVGNVGTGSTVFTSATTFENCNTYDVFIEHTLTQGTVNAIAEISKVSNASEDTLSLLISGASDGSLTINGRINGIFSNVVTEISTLLIRGSGMGLMYNGILYNTSGLQLNLTAGFGYLTKPNGTLVKLEWGDSQYIAPANTQAYVYFNENSNLIFNSDIPDLISNIYLGRIGTTSNGFEFISNNCIQSNHISNSFAKTLINGFGAVYNRGSIVSENISNPRHLDITQGVYYISTTELNPSGGTDIDFNLYYQNGTGGYTFTITNVLSNTNYNGTNGGLVSIPTDKYVKYSLYTVSDGNDEKYFAVYPQHVYDALLQAQEALLPIPPNYFNNDIVLISSIIIKQGVNNIIEIRDNRPILGSTPQGVSASADHSSLLNLNHDDHLQYLLVSGDRAMSGNLNMGSNNITTVGTVNGVTVESHASRHLPNGLDPLTTGVPVSINTTNQEGTSNAFARQDHVHAITNNAVTYAKIQNVSGNKILGNVGVSGNVEELETTSGIILSGKTIGLALSGVTANSYNFVTANNRGIITTAVNKPYLTGNQTISVTGDATASGSTGLALTLATVNSDIGTFNNITINAKGLATAGSNKDYTTNQTVTLSGDITGAGSSGITTTIANNVVSNAKFRQSVGVSVVGRSTNSTGNVGDITASSDGQVLKRVGGVVGFNSIGTNDISNTAVTYAKVQNVTANRILGRVTSTGAIQELALSSGLAFSGASITTDSSVVTLTDTQTLTNKTITSGRFNQLLDTVGNISLDFASVGAANYLTVYNGGGGASPKIVATGSDTNINLQLESKGTGTLAFQVGSAYLMSLPTTAPTTDQVLQYNGSAYIWNTISGSSSGGVGAITLTGDVTGSGSAGITTTIANSAVTYAKIQNVSGSKILGNAGGIGNIEELETTSGISISGRTIFADYVNSPYKNICRVTTTANLTANYSNGAAGVGATLTATTNVVLPTQDGVSLAVGDRILVKNQTTTFQNGIYVVTSLGSAGASPWVLTRAIDSNTAIKIYQTAVTVKEGTTFTSTKWLNTNTAIAITIGTTAISYVIAGGYIISTGLTLTNRTLTATPAAASITRAMLANSVAVSVIGRSANSTGVPADIAASSDGQVLKRVGGVVGFNSIGTNDISNTAVTYAKVQNVTANRILGRVTSTGAIQELALSSGLAFSGASIIASGGNLTGTTVIDEASWSANTNYSKTLTVTGAAVNDRVEVTITPSLLATHLAATGGITLIGYVNSANTVTVWARTTQFLTVSGSWYVTVFK